MPVISQLFNNLFKVIAIHPLPVPISSYISYDDIEVMDIVKNNEPHLALYAKDNGLYFYDTDIQKYKQFKTSKSHSII